MVPGFCFLSLGFCFLLLLIFSAGIGFKNGTIQFRFVLLFNGKKRKLIAGLKCLPLWTLDERVRQIIRVNQLSGAKLYPQRYVNKRITALFGIFGIYARTRKTCIYES